ncbi:MAG: hypothetical protein AVDCRST_MAG77-2043, partial [uncultured Chloroflexi bacterium]
CRACCRSGAHPQRLPPATRTPTPAATIITTVVTRTPPKGI